MGEVSYGCPEWDLGIMWIMGLRMSEERADMLFHLKPEQLKEHWNIFLPAYLGTTDPEKLGTFTRRIIPFYAVKVPYVYDMAFHTALPEDSIQRIGQMLGI